MALTGEFVACNATFAFLEPGSVTNYYNLSTYVNADVINRTRGEAETTAHTGCDKTFIPALMDGSYDFTLMHNNVPALAQQPQVRLRQMFESGVITTWRVHEQGDGSGLPELTFKGFLLDFVAD